MSDLNSSDILGKTNQLRVVKQLDFGLYLDGGELGEILLPNKFIPENCKPGDLVKVFVYLDSDDQPIATTQRPRIQVGRCAHLKCVEVNKIGAFMDWGLAKDLLVPFGEQSKPMREGYSYTVFAYIDNASQRIAGSTKLNRFLPETADGNFSPGLPVKLLISGRTDMGYKAVIDGTHLGLLHKSEALQGIQIGKKIDGFIKDIRDDGRINLCLQKHNKASRDQLQQQILDYLESQDGVSYLTDKSLPEAIYAQFKVSKGSYKKALGGLYKQKLIRIETDQISLNKY
ncbi:S1-like domain-containing RNA-binding protein [Porticoccus sp. W117]|uniref:CvfB family protein n=1 Tax=Porticoccus sp. W117 TaxID=3054777 RepID=UPI002593BE72|nr:S1-like domain-containing RNA-binding protein [Porticoccus sp. W117]MDM3869894.1 S1-like domain-containing RNA-binding protein [Porticoccus sp. W117]